MDAQEAGRVQTRPRRREAHQVWQLWVRVPTAAYALALFIYICYYMGKWNGTLDPWDYEGKARKNAARDGAAALVAALMSLSISGWEIYTYISHTREAPLSGRVVCLDVIELGVALAGFFALFFADWSWESPSWATERPWEGDETLATWLALGLACWHTLISIAGCCGCCFGQMSPDKPSKRVTTSRALPTATTRDVASVEVQNQTQNEAQPPPYYQEVELQETPHKEPPPDYPGPNNGQASSS